MKTFIKNLAFFAVFAACTYVALIFVFGFFVPESFRKNLKYHPAGPGHLYTRLKEADTTKNVDILFLGSSHTFRGYDTRKFRNLGLSVFNLGSSAQTPMQTELLVNEYIDQFRPKAVVFDIYPFVLGSDGVESTLDLLANQVSNTNSFSLALKAQNVKVYNSLIFDFLQESLDMHRNIKEPIIKKNGDNYIAGGYVATYRRFRPDAKFKRRKGSYEVNDTQVDALKRILSKLNARNIPFILIQGPVTQKLYRSMANNKEMDKLLSSYGRYYNFNEVQSLEDSLFYDESHLNQYGVDIFNEYVIQTIRKDFKHLPELRKAI